MSGVRKEMFCDYCGDIVLAVRPIKIEFPGRETLEILICIECWDKCFEKKSRKLKVARMLEILLDDTDEEESEDASSAEE